MGYDVGDARDDLEAMRGPQGLLRRVHDESVAPRGGVPEVSVTTSIGPKAPRYGDPRGVAAYEAAGRELALVCRGLGEFGARLPTWVVNGTPPSPREADQVCRAALACLDRLADLRASETGTGGPRRRGGLLTAVKRARSDLQAAAGHTQVQAPPPMCRTKGCRERSVPGEARRCASCLDHHQAHGSYPDRVVASGSTADAPAS